MYGERRSRYDPKIWHPDTGTAAAVPENRRPARRDRRDRPVDLHRGGNAGLRRRARRRTRVGRQQEKVFAQASRGASWRRLARSAPVTHSPPAHTRLWRLDIHWDGWIEDT